MADPRRVSLFPLAFVACLAAEALAAQRVFVASYGSDANSWFYCTLSAPCRTFAVAMIEVDAGGEVVALDAAGYGAVTIDKSLTITTNPGYHAGIAASAGNAITINGLGIDVVLRGLNVTGFGANTGINMIQGASLAVESCVVANFAQHGVIIEPAARVRFADTIIRGNGYSGLPSYDGIRIRGGAVATLHNVRMTGNGSGITVQEGPNLTTTVAVTSSDASDNSFYGFRVMRLDQSPAATGAARMTIEASSASNNHLNYIVDNYFTSDPSKAWLTIGSSSATGGYGFFNPWGTLETYGDNVLFQLDVVTLGVITPVARQ